MEQIRLLNSKSTDLDWYYSKYFWKLKLLIHDLLFTTFMKPSPSPGKYLLRNGYHGPQLTKQQAQAANAQGPIIVYFKVM